MKIMSQQTEQQSKYITVEEFLPKWTDWMEKIVENKLSWMQVDQIEHKVGAELSIVKPQCCLVGEANGFSDSYSRTCGVCNALSFKQAINSHSSAVFGDLKPYYEFKQELYKHMMAHHSELLLRK